MNEQIKPRKSIMDFAVTMEEKLKKNDFKGGWIHCQVFDLIRKLEDEVYELKKESENICMMSSYSDIRKKEMFDRISSETADVANYAMMISDRVKFLKERT